MEQLYSVWALFEKEDEEYLSHIIRGFNQKYDTDFFLPHITLFGNIAIDEARAIEAIDTARSGVSPIIAMSTGIAYSTDWAKTFYIQFEQNPQLSALSGSLNSSFSGQAEYAFDPHASLIYKTDMTEEQKLDELKKIKLKKDYRLNRVVLATPLNQTEKWLDVASWRIRYEKALG